MALEVGNYLSQEMCDYIDHWTDFTEQKELAIAHEYSVELTRALVRRTRKLNESNIGLATSLIKLAIQNRKPRLKADSKAHKEALKVEHN